MIDRQARDRILHPPLMDLPREKHSPSPVTGRSPAKPVPVVDVPTPAADEDADLSIGEEIFNRPVESIPPGPPPRDRKRPAMNNDLNPPPSEVKEVEPRKKRGNPLEKRNTAPLNEFKRVVRPQTALAASAAVDHAKAESPVPLEAVERDAMEFGKVHNATATPDFRPNKLHSVLDSAYKHSRLRWMDWVDRVGPWVIIGTVLLLGVGVFFALRIINTPGEGAATTQIETGVKTLSAADRIARGKTAVEQFIQAQTNEARLPLVMDPERANARMAQFYGEGGRNPSIVSWDVGKPVGSKNGDWLPFVFTDGAGRSVTVALGETATGCIVDWENFVAYGDMPWQEFCRTKPTAAKALRVRLRRAERYQETFPKEAWQAWEVEHRSGGPVLTAYASRAGRSAQALEELVKGENWQCALVYLRFDPAAPQEGVVVIEDIVRTRWQDEATSWTGP